MQKEPEIHSLNLNTRFASNYGQSTYLSQPIWYLPEALGNITSVKLKNFTIPLSVYNIDTRNNQIAFVESTSTSSNRLLSLPSRNYTGLTLASQLQESLNSVGTYLFSVSFQTNGSNVLTISSGTGGNVKFISTSNDAYYETGLENSLNAFASSFTTGSIDMSGVNSVPLVSNVGGTDVVGKNYKILSTITTEESALDKPIKNTSSTIQLPDYFKTPNNPITFVNKPPDSVYLKYGRGVFEAQQEALSQEERRQAIGFNIGTKRIVSHLAKKSQEEQTIKKVGSPLNTSPVDSGVGGSSTAQMTAGERLVRDMDGVQLSDTVFRLGQSVFKPQEPIVPKKKGKSKATASSPTPEPIVTSPAIVAREPAKQEPLVSEPVPMDIDSPKQAPLKVGSKDVALKGRRVGKRKDDNNFEKPPKRLKKDLTVAGTKRKGAAQERAGKKFKQDTAIAGAKRKGDKQEGVGKKPRLKSPAVKKGIKPARVIKRKAVAAAKPAPKKIKIDDTIAGTKRPAPPTIRKVGGPSKKQKTSDEKGTRLASGKTLRRLKPVNYKE